MKRCLGSIILAILAVVSGVSAGVRLQEVTFDQNVSIVSINVEGITIGRLLRLWDQATGMQSSISPELADRTVSANISRLGVNAAVRKIFEKLPFDYVFIEGQ